MEIPWRSQARIKTPPLFAARDGGLRRAHRNSAAAKRTWASAIPHGFQVLISAYSSLVHVAGPVGGFQTLVVTYRSDTGQELWRDLRLGGSGSIAVSPNTNDLYWAASRANVVNPTSGEDWALIAFRGATGEVLWTSGYDFLRQTEYIPQVSVSDDGGRVYASGLTAFDDNTRWLTTVAFNAANGATLWDARYGLHKRPRSLTPPHRSPPPWAAGITFPLTSRSRSHRIFPRRV